MGRLLDPIDRLAEATYSVLIVLTFTLAFRIFVLGSNPGQGVSAEHANELLIGAIGATVAWGVIDGTMYALFSMFERGEKHRVLVHIQAATTRQEGIEAVADELDHILEPILQREKRNLLYADVLEHLHDSQPQPVGLTREDLAGALGSVLVAIVAVLPSLAPLVLLRGDYALAIRLSNVVSFVVLFVAGYQWGKYTGASPWKTGLLLLAVAALMVAIAILLGG